MRNVTSWLTLLLLLVMCAGCSRPAQHSLEGTWKLDVDRQMSDPSYKLPADVPAEARKKAEDEIRAKMADRGVVFTNSRMTVRSPEKLSEGTYKVAAQNGNAWSLETDLDGRAQKYTVEWTDDDHLVMVIEGTPARMYLVRAR